MTDTQMTAAQRAAFNAAAAAKCNAEFHARRILEGKRPAWVTQADIDRIAAVAADDVRRAAGGRIDINPYSTTGVRAEWQLGYDLKPHGHHGVPISGVESWSAIWERGVQARLLIDKEKENGKADPS